ncbi:MAG: hypothetical protein ACI4R9_04405 [Kiritimatiellia bacterium]
MIGKWWKGALFVFLTALAFQVRAVTQVEIEHDTSGVRLGYWTSDFAAAKAYADAHNVPFVGFWGSSGCGYCALMKSSGLLSSEFLEWVQTHKIVMCFVEVAASETLVMTDAKKFIKGSNTSGLYPFMTFYWKKADGSQVKVDFSGRKGSIPPYVSGTTGAQFVAGLNQYFGSYKPAEDYTGGYFTVTNNTANARLEALVGKTSVNIPLVRTASVVATNTLQVVGGTSSSVIWAKGVTNQVVKCTLPSGQAAGTKLTLNLLAADGKTVKSTTYVTIVNAPAVSLTNPKWIGESFSAGEWTMDLDAALAKAKAATTTRQYTLAYASGVLWCPYCASLESKVLATTNFTAWAKANNVNLVLLDNPKRSASDIKDANGNVTSVGTKNDGAPPTLLRYEIGSNGKSGAAYLSRKDIAVADAEKILQRNHDLLYKGGKLVAPEAMRTGYPTLILVNSDGTAAAHLLSGCDSATTSWGLSLAETLSRLNELLALDGSNMRDSAPSTTTKTLSIEETSQGGGQVNANTTFFKLANVPAGKVAFEVQATRGQSAVTPVLTVYETSSTLANAKKLGSAAGSLTVTFADGQNKYLAVSHYGDNLSVFGGNTAYQFTVRSTMTLVPVEKASTFTTKSGVVKLSVVKGSKYKLSGFSSYAGFTANTDGTYTANLTGDVTMSASANATLTYQLWVPGSIQFAVASASKLEADGSGTITIARTGGSSGAATVTVSVDSGSLGTGRVSLSASTFTWGDGVSGSKTLTYKIAQDATFHAEETFVLTLVKSAATAAALGGNTKFSLKISDSDDPVLPEADYSLRLYKGMTHESRYAVNNIRENKHVSVVRGGSLPSGMKLVYDSSSKQLVFSGKPTRAGSYKFTVAVTERRSDKTATGTASTFTVTVVDPTKLTPGQAGYNPVLTAGTTVYASVPVYGKSNGYDVLAGVATVKAYRTGRASVSYRGADNARVTGSGVLTLDDSGTISLAYSRGSVSMNFAIDGNGKATLRIAGLANSYGSTLSTLGGYPVINGNLSAYAGYYTVTLPFLGPVGNGGTTFPTGTGYVNLKMSTSTFSRLGKVSYAGMLPNGRAFSGYAYLSGASTGDDGAQWAYLPISVYKSGARAGVVLRIKKNAASVSKDNPRVVLAAPEAEPYATVGNRFAILGVYGGIYDKTLNFAQCCKEYYETTRFKVSSLVDGFAPSERYGAIATVPDATVHVEANDSFTVVNADSKHTVTLRLTKSTGVVTGRMTVSFAGGSKVTLTVKGVVLVGWTDCGCSDTVATGGIERSIFSGAAYYSDRVDGASTQRGFAVELTP